MRIVFMGTPEFAADILAEIIPVHEVVAVVTRPDAVRKRGGALVASPVKMVAQDAGIPVLCPKTLRDAAVQEQIRSYLPDVICVAAYGALLPPEVLAIPTKECVNVHASILPRWRGAAPIQRAVLAGDDELGVCIMRMEEGLDTGAWCVIRRTSAEGKDAARLTAELAELGARALLTALEQIDADCVRWMPQDEGEATYADKIAKGELNLSPDQSASVNERRVRASDDAHPAKCMISDKSVRVLAAKAKGAAQGYPGEVVWRNKELLLVCEEGMLVVITIKPDGKRAMSAEQFVAGIPAIREGHARWGAWHA